MRRVLLWLLLVLCVPQLGWGQAQLINGSRVITGWINYGLTTGTGAAYVLTLSPALPGYVDGACFLFRAHVANTGDASLNVNGRGATPMRKWSAGSAVPLVAGDISAQQDVHVCYDSTNGPRMQMLAAIGGTTGGSGITTMPTAADQVLISDSSTTGTWQTLPNCPDSGGNHLNYNIATNQWICGTSGGTVGSVAFSAITGGTNTSAAMIVGTGSSLATTGSGSITATNVNPPLSVTSGGHGAAPSTGDQVFVSDTPSTGTWRTLPNCPDSGGNHLNYDISTNTWLCGTSGGAGGGVTASGTPVDNQVAVWLTASQIEGTSALTYSAGTLGIGAAGTLGKLTVAGNTSGVVTVQPQATAGTYNFNLPTTAGTSGQVLTSAGGGAAPMTWTTPTGGTGHTIQDEGSALTARTGLNFTGAGIACSDDSANNRTTCAVSGTSGGAGIFGTPTPGQVAIWHDATSVEGTSTLSLAYAATHPTTSGTITTGIEYVTTGAGGVTRTLPAAASGTTTREFAVYKEDAAAGALSIAPAGSDTINGSPTPLSTTTRFAGFVLKEVAGTGWVSTALLPTVGGTGNGDFISDVTTSVDGEMVLFAGTTGKHGKRATTTGVLKATAGVPAQAVAGTDITTPAGVEDLTNKRVGPTRAQLSAASGPVTAPDASINGKAIYFRFDISGALTIPAPTGTPLPGQRLIFQLKPQATPQTLTFAGGPGGFCAVSGLNLLPTITGDNATYVEYSFVYTPEITPNSCWLLDGTTKATAPLSLADGGTGASLSDPGADRILVWDNTDKATKQAVIGSGLAYNAATDTLTATGGGIGTIQLWPGMLTLPDGTAGNALAPTQVFQSSGTVTNGPKLQATDLLFDNVSTDQSATACVNVPSDYNAAQPTTLYLNWRRTANTTAQDVIFKAAVFAMKPNSGTVLTTKSFGTVVSSAAAAAGTVANAPRQTSFVLNMDSAAARDTICVMLGRDSDAAGDTLGDPVALMNAWLEYTKQ